MDRDLLRQSLGCHGPALLSLLRSEQQDNPHFRSLLGTAAEPARGAAPPPGAGRYGDRNPGRGAGRGSDRRDRAPGCVTRIWLRAEWPGCAFRAAAKASLLPFPERMGLKLLPELGG